MPQHRTQEQRSNQTRGRLIAATIGSICERGYLSTTTTEIADRAGVSRGALQHHFGTKSDLLLSVLDRICEGFKSRVEAASKCGGSLETRSDELVQTLWEVYGGDTYEAAVEIVLGARSDPDLNGRIQEFRALSIEIAEDLWAQVFSDVDLPPQRLADLLHFTVAAMRGFALHNKSENDEEFYRRQLALLRDFLVYTLRSGKDEVAPLSGSGAAGGDDESFVDDHGMEEGSSRPGQCRARRGQISGQ